MAGYTRQSTFADGDTITAALFNNEYNQLVNAFSNTSGHKHDGTAAEGPVIGLIGDAGLTTPLNKILIDTTNDHIEFWVDVSSSSVQQLYIADGAIIPVTDNDIDLGTSSLEFKNLYLDGTAKIDVLTVDEAATIGTTLGVTGATTLSSTLGVTGATTLSSTLGVTGATTLSSTLAVTGTSTFTGNVTTTNDLSVGGNLTVTGNATISGNLTFGDADTDSITLTADVASHITPDVDDTYDLGTATKQWRNLYIDGTAEVDTLSIDGTAVTSTAAELNILDGVTATAAEINTLDGITATVAELNILDGVTSTATELNIVDGDTAATATTLADADRVVVNDAGVMKQVALTDFETYFESALDTLSNVTTVGALNSGSITSGFGAIDNGSSNITTTGTVTYGSLSDGVITITAFADEDDMVSNSATLIPTQQSVKAYVDSQVTAQDLDLTTDSGTIAIDLDSETLTVAGGTGIDTSASANSVTVAIDSTVATLTGTQTLTNKTLTSPDINTPDIDGGTIDGTVIGGATPAAADFTTMDTTGNASVGGDLSVTGDLTINGTTTTVNSTTVTVDDPIFTLGGDTAPVADDNKDRGIEFRWHNGTAAKVGFFGYDDSASVFTFIPDATNTSEVFSGSAGDVAFGNIAGTLTTAAQTNITSVGTLSSLTVSGEITANGGIALGDNDKATFGASDDLEIYHDGSNSYIEDVGTGALFLKSSSGIYLKGKTTDEDLAQLLENGAVTLYYDGSPKISTTASGVDVTGTAVVDGLTVDNTAASSYGTIEISGTTGAFIDLKSPETDDYDLRLITTGSGGQVNAASGTLDLQVGGSGKISISSTGVVIDNGTIKLDGNYPTGTGNVALGNSALDSVTASGNGQNIAIGDAAGTAITSGERNIAIGANALDANVDTDRNIAIGVFALSAQGATGTGETNNIAIGYNAQGATTSGTGNIAIGSIALDANTTGSDNTALGYRTLSSSTTASNNVAIGSDALISNTTASFNNAVGYQALYSNTTGSDLVGIGSSALYNNTTGTRNVALGNNALNAVTTGTNNTGLGDRALRDNTGSNNTAAGSDALLVNTTGVQNTAVGSLALDANTTANSNTGVGYVSLSSNTTGAQNSALGDGALFTNSTASNNTAMGYVALYSNTTGASNAAFGANALDANTTGNSNTALGYFSLSNNTTASNNTAIGSSALAGNTTGTQNVAIGFGACDNSTTLNNLTAVGYEACGAGVQGSDATAVGSQALYNNTGASNNAFGYATLYNNTSAYQNTSMGSISSYNITTGYRNTSYGYAAHYSGTTGANNTNVGWYAGYGLTTGNNNICIGYGAGYNGGTNGISTGSDGIYIGANAHGNNDNSKEIVLGQSTRGIGGDRLTFGEGVGGNRVYNSYTVDASWTRVSDERYKTEIQDNNDCGLNFINDLRPVTFKWKALSDIDADLPDHNPEKTEPEHKEKLYGLIAQEVKEALEKNNITDFGGWNVEESSGIQAISQEMFIHPLIKAVQELSSQVESLKQEINDIKGGN